MNAKHLAARYLSAASQDVFWDVDTFDWKDSEGIYGWLARELGWGRRVVSLYTGSDQYAFLSVNSDQAANLLLKMLPGTAPIFRPADIQFYLDARKASTNPAPLNDPIYVLDPFKLYRILQEGNWYALQDFVQTANFQIDTTDVQNAAHEVIEQAGGKVVRNTKHLAARYREALQGDPDPQEIADILTQALAQVSRGGMYHRAKVWRDGSIRGAHRDPDVPKYGFDDPNDLTYTVKARQAMQRWHNIIDPLFRPFGSKVQVITVSSEKGWVDTTIKIR